MLNKQFAIGICLAAMAAGMLFTGALLAQTRHVVLITNEEAKRPSAAALTFRAGISRGPGIELLSPKPSEKSVVSPVHLQLKFEGHGGAQIDLASFKLTDACNPPVDLTDRIKDFTQASGIDVPEAEIPPGTYTIHAEVKDNEGRVGLLTFDLTVAK